MRAKVNEQPGLVGQTPAADTERGWEGRGERERDLGLEQRKWSCSQGGGIRRAEVEEQPRLRGKRPDSRNLEVEVLMLMAELGVGAALVTAAAVSQLFNIMITPLGSGKGGGPIGSPSLGPFLSTEPAGTASSWPPGASRPGSWMDDEGGSGGGGGGGGGCRKLSAAASQLLWFWSSIIAS